MIGLSRFAVLVLLNCSVQAGFAACAPNDELCKKHERELNVQTPNAVDPQFQQAPNQQWGPSSQGYQSQVPMATPYVQQQPMSSRCGTPYGACLLNGTGPVGVQCFCVSPQGAQIPGQVF
jgi:hypothetical protein